MCGIAGIINSVEGIDPVKIKKMTDTIAARGPDAEGFLFAGDSECKLFRVFEHPGYHPQYALGHRRLSIIDLEGGIQPMCNEDGTIWLTYNGEIYNHQDIKNELKAFGHIFRSDHSDTEVIVHSYEQWGIEGFGRFNGIFAFGILDLRGKKLVLARDPFGVKPLYYYSKNGKLVFSSEIKAILACDEVERHFDYTALNNYLDFRYVPSPRTAFQDINKIAAGGYLEFDLETSSISRTGDYAYRQTTIDYSKSFSQWVDEYQEHFEQAVKKQLISDVEIGALLSGGVDSSAVCAIAVKELGHPIRTYTVGFKDFTEGNEFDEASEFAKFLGTIHKNVIIDDFDFIKVLDEVAWFMDEPTATSSSIPLYYLTKEIKKDVKVVLTGQGADEPLAGYQRYWGERLYQSGFKYLGGMQPFIECLPRQEQLKRAFRSFGRHDTLDRFLNVYYLFNPEQKKSLLKKPLPQDSDLFITKLFHQYSADDDLGRMLYIDTRSWLPDDLLIYGDKATMINSIEARVPFLDRDFVYFVESMPSKYKLSMNLKGKFVHKKACEKWLPPYVIKRPKKGFATPIDKWFRAELGGYVREQLLEGSLCGSLFNISFVEEMIEKHQAGKENFQRHLFALLMLEKWAEKFDVAV
ncbi:asparagine synthase (glutamine-hydrolyzing) [Geobacter sp. AOG1]|uniref:asparagine synthase (glutamine-hydrolyzing) n=1 Tax=Geobacter sp. AOG1 TaxID=1566346 RepID=UPI001CC5F28E|nr:asparagine synthase (glutamine-hydrolyzing) [Geobacter sp. AOG1]GFE58384.1 asparagine synthetase B [Geobacter sp. AOG1]